MLPITVLVIGVMVSLIKSYRMILLEILFFLHVRMDNKGN